MKFLLLTKEKKMYSNIYKTILNIMSNLKSLTAAHKKGGESLSLYQLTIIASLA